MTPTQQAQAHDHNFVAAISLLAEMAPTGWTGRYGAVRLAVTGVPGAFFNAMWVLKPTDSTVLPAAVDGMRESGFPFVVHVRSDLPELISAAGSLGLTDGGRLPCFAIEPRPIPPPLDDLSIERVRHETWGDFLDATMEGFDMSREMVEKLFGPGLLDDDRVRPFVAKLDGRVVATSMSIRTDATVGIYSIATVPEARGRGIGTAMTWHLIADADPGWDVAVLQASDIGRPVYERMGFKLVREFVEFLGIPTQG